MSLKKEVGSQGLFWFLTQPKQVRPSEHSQGNTVLLYASNAVQGGFFFFISFLFPFFPLALCPFF